VFKTGSTKKKKSPDPEKPTLHAVEVGSQNRVWRGGCRKGREHRPGKRKRSPGILYCPRPRPKIKKGNVRNCGCWEVGARIGSKNSFRGSAGGLFEKYEGGVTKRKNGGRLRGI